MTEEVETSEETTDNKGGKIKISNEVISTIAGISTTEVEGVAGMSGGIAGGLAEMLGQENLSKGVEVEVGNQEVAIELYVVMEEGVRIQQVAREIQSNVQHTVESRTGLEVVEVNVNVQGVEFAVKASEDDAEAEETVELADQE